MVAIGKHFGLQRQERAAGVDEVHTGQTVLQRDVLRAYVLLDGDREVRPALHRRIVGDDHHFAARDAADACDQSGPRRIAVVHVERRERRELQEGRTGIEQPIDPIADRQLALLAMPFDVFRAAALAGGEQTLPQLGDELLHAVTIALKGRVGGIDVRREDFHDRWSLIVRAWSIHLEPAGRAAPDGVHAVHFSATAVALRFGACARRGGRTRSRARRRDGPEGVAHVAPPAPRRSSHQEPG